MSISSLGKLYSDQEVIVRQGESGDCMYVIQEGQVQVIREDEGKQLILATLGKGDFFGEMSIFEREVRSATVRALGEARILTIDKRTFLRRVKEDPTLAFNILKMMSRRIRNLDEELLSVKGKLGSLAVGDEDQI
jgi:CRP/FNR family transcriptional regulator